MKTLTLVFGLMGLLVVASLAEAQGGYEAFGRRGGRRGFDQPQQAKQPQQQAAAKPAPRVESRSAAQPEVDKDEVIRRGNLEEYVDGESRFSTEDGDHIAQIASTPANDNEKWFISVISRKDCPACDRLKEAWKTDDTLRAYAKPDLPRESWAHFTWYDYNDPYQSWRWTKTPQNPNPIEITAFPTVVVQPPRSKAYGNPQTVVLKYVWEGDSAKMAQAINGSIRAYVDTLHKSNELNVVEPEKQSRVASGGFQALDDGTLYCQLDPRDLVAEAPSSIKGIGQQQVPPLVLPNDDRTPPSPKHDRAISARPHILIVTDESLVSSPEQDKVLKSTVDSIQPAVPVKVYQKDIKDGAVKRLGVKAEEVPVVLLVEGDDIVEKRQVPRVNAELGGPILSGLFGLGSIVSYLCAAIGIVIFWGIILLSVILGVKVGQALQVFPKPLWGGSKLPAAPAPASPAPASPAPTPPGTST